MKYDCIIIGGGLAGLTCGIKCCLAGLKCAVFSAGMSALHFSSGSLDVLGHHPGREVVFEPFDALPSFLESRPDHPYARLSPDFIYDSLDFLREQAELRGLKFYANGRRNHFHVTALGSLKPTYLSQDSVFNDKIKQAFEKGLSIAILTYDGFRDFHPGLAAANLSRHALFKNAQVATGSISLPDSARRILGNPGDKKIHELRSMDICRLMEINEVVDDIAKSINQVAGDALLVGLPAVLGLTGFSDILKKLEEKTGRLIYEAPTLPPSILGMRIDDALKTRFADLGGVYIAGDRVVGGTITAGRLDHVHTKNYGPARLRADHFVLAAGSFFSGGLVSEFKTMREPVFGLDIHFQPAREQWSSKRYFDTAGHPFISFGVETDDRFRPSIAGKTIENLYCAGAVLAHYDPVLEGSGAGVAVGTAYAAAQNILQKSNIKAQ